MKITFKINSEYIEMIKLLKATGLCASGGIAKTAVAEGRVEVDNHTELRKRCKIRKGQVVAFENNIIELE